MGYAYRYDWSNDGGEDARAEYLQGRREEAAELLRTHAATLTDADEAHRFELRADYCGDADADVVEIAAIIERGDGAPDLAELVELLDSTGYGCETCGELLAGPPPARHEEQHCADCAAKHALTAEMAVRDDLDRLLGGAL